MIWPNWQHLFRSAPTPREVGLAVYEAGSQLTSEISENLNLPVVYVPGTDLTTGISHNLDRPLPDIVRNLGVVTLVLLGGRYVWIKRNSSSSTTPSTPASSSSETTSTTATHVVPPLAPPAFPPPHLPVPRPIDQLHLGRHPDYIRSWLETHFPNTGRTAIFHNQTTYQDNLHYITVMTWATKLWLLVRNETAGSAATNNIHLRQGSKPQHLNKEKTLKTWFAARLIYHIAWGFSGTPDLQQTLRLFQTDIKPLNVNLFKYVVTPLVKFFENVLGKNLALRENAMLDKNLFRVEQYTNQIKLGIWSNAYLKKYPIQSTDANASAGIMLPFAQLFLILVGGKFVEQGRIHVAPPRGVLKCLPEEFNRDILTDFIAFRARLITDCWQAIPGHPEAPATMPPLASAPQAAFVDLTHTDPFGIDPPSLASDAPTVNHDFLTRATGQLIAAGIGSGMVSLGMNGDIATAALAALGGIAASTLVTTSPASPAPSNSDPPELTTPPPTRHAVFSPFFLRGRKRRKLTHP